LSFPPFAISPKGDKRFGGISPADFFTSGFGAWLVCDGEFFDCFTHPDSFGGDFGTEFESLAFEIHSVDQRAAECFVARGFVGEFLTEEHFDGKAEEEVNDFVGESHSVDKAVVESGTVNGI
jgi:hypothetical protein